ncbi:MAG TPA: leucyl/phenylalanyl-tRNA--protein transferase [Phycisphaerales bacterium]|jgi:leucyl/phenylalanyl-tRNA--protein transferase|nr:leucyl/phenylalanyl-tRNA--protein transferase [Phycisphaerales bacterium]
MTVIPPHILLNAYSQGFFPMADPDRPGEVDWFQPDPRAVLELDDLRVSNSLRRVVRNDRFAIRTNTCFESVIRACAATGPDRPESWIDDDLIASYGQLHELGHAHSVEAFFDGQLVGGLYGVHLQAAFMGESMFCRPECGGTDASKVCLVWLVSHLRAIGVTLLDVQWTTEHLERLGVTEVPESTYASRMESAMARQTHWGPLPATGAQALSNLSSD